MARSFNSIRSYYFREAVALREHEQREYGGRSLEDYTLEDFRDLWQAAHRLATETQRQARTRWVDGAWVTL